MLEQGYGVAQVSRPSCCPPEPLGRASGATLGFYRKVTGSQTLASKDSYDRRSLGLQQGLQLFS